MVVTEEKRDQINHKIEKRKFASNDAALFAGHINHGMHQIQLSLVKISRNHIGETLAPIVRRFQRSMGYAYQTKNEKAKQPKTNIPENPVQNIDCLIDHRSEEYENECKQKYGFTLPGTNIEFVMHNPEKKTKSREAVLTHSIFLKPEVFKHFTQFFLNHGFFIAVLLQSVIVLTAVLS